MSPRRPALALPRLVVLAAGGALLLAACTGDDEAPAAPVESPTVFVPATGTPRAIATARPIPTPTPVVTPTLGTPLSEERTAEVLALLLERRPDRDALAGALAEVVAQRDVRFIAPLIELLRAGPGKLASYDGSYFEVLEQLSGGARPGRDWGLWTEWYGQTDLEPPPGFTAWKGQIFSRIDERFTEFLNEDTRSTIPVEQIAWGGVPVDGITPLDNPPLLSAAAATYLEPTEPVFGVVANGEARAYPLRIMDAHEMANDVLGGIPFSLAYCTLCGSGIAYDARGPDGVIYTFSTSGLLYQSNKLMYDRQTGSLWSHFTGRPVLGPLVDAAEGTRGSLLDVLPIVVTSWEDWVAAHPDTTVLDIETGIGFGYTLGYPYLQYFTSGDTIFPVAERSRLLPQKAWIYGLNLEGEQQAYELDALTAAGVLNDTVGGVDLVVIAVQGVIDVDAEAPVFGTLSYEAGGEVRSYERPPGLEFTVGPDAATLLDGAGSAWRITEEALVGPDGREAPRIIGSLSFWFGWFQFFPLTELFTG